MEANTGAEAKTGVEAKTGAEAKTGVEPKPSELKDKATFIETRIAHEINLMGQRMTWLVTSQSFLFAAWVQLIRSQPVEPQDVENPDAALLYYVVPAIGLAVSVAGWVATAAAMLMVDTLVIDRASVDGLLGLTPMSPLRKHSKTRLAGHVPTELLPPLFVTAWLVVIVRKLRWNDWILLATALLFVLWLLLRIVITLARHEKSKALAQVKAAGNIKFQSARAVVVHLKDHGTELPRSERVGASATRDEFVASAQKTIQGATTTRSVTRTGKRQVHFLREVLTEDGTLYKMLAIVTVPNDGKAYLESYENLDKQ